MPEPVWTPSPERIASSNLARFTLLAQQRSGRTYARYADLYAWSVADPEAFWSCLWAYADVIASQPYSRVLDNGDRMPGAAWFPGARLNFAENLLRFDDDRPAIVFRDENGARSQLSYSELSAEVTRISGALQACGVSPGDRVAALMPNIPETVIAMLATTRLGATWSSCSPDFGIAGVLDRFGQIRPKVLFTVDGYFYAGKTIDTLGTARKLVAALEDLAQVVVVPFAGTDPDLDGMGNAVRFDQLRSNVAPPFAQLPFDHPVYIMYSSGTTGTPKCIVHGAGGTLLQHMKEHALHTDVTRADRLFYFTTCGWMMWNWLVSGLARGATLVLFDGSPFYPDAGALWRMADEEGVSIFGTSAKYLSAVEKAGYSPRKSLQLKCLRTVLSTGSPLAPESYDFVYREIGRDLQLASISGGTDILSCFALGSPVLPVYRGELQCRGLGMKVEVFDDDGKSLVGEKGELVCTAPFPSMPVGFWNDPDGSKYHDAYFARFDNIWCHGDYAELTPRGGIVIYGRSDAVLNPGGVRIGTAEIYRQVEKLDEILDSVAVGQDWDDDVRVVLFVVLRDGVSLDDALLHKLRSTIRQGASPRHVPAKIIAVAEIPRTLSGKIVELAVRNVIHGRPVKNTDAMANPHALKLFANLPALREP